MSYSEQQWADVCQHVKSLVPKSVGEDAWYLVIVASLAVSPTPSLPASFYTYLTNNDPAFASKEAQEHLSQRLRDVLLKLLTIVGGPQVLSALIPFAEAEGNTVSRAESSTLSEKWQAEKMSVPAIYSRGLKTINSIYGASLLEKIFSTWGSHKEDVKFNEIFALYGLYLSDFEVLTPLETEAVVFSSISCLGLGGPGNWHLRGMGRLLGAKGKTDGSEEMKQTLQDLMNLRQAVMGVVQFVGGEFLTKAKMERWATVEDVMRDLGGWGSDED